MVFEQMKRVIFKRKKPPAVIWEVLYNDKGRIMLKRQGRLVATRLCDNGSIEAVDYKVRFQPSEVAMYSYQVVEMQRRRSHKTYSQERRKYMKAI